MARRAGADERGLQGPGIGRRRATTRWSAPLARARAPRRWRRRWRPRRPTATGPTGCGRRTRPRRGGPARARRPPRRWRKAASPTMRDERRHDPVEGLPARRAGARTAGHPSRTNVPAKIHQERRMRCDPASLRRGLGGWLGRSRRNRRMASPEAVPSIPALVLRGTYGRTTYLRPRRRSRRPPPRRARRSRLTW